MTNETPTKKPKWPMIVIGCAVMACLCPVGLFLSFVPQANRFAQSGTCMGRITNTGWGVLLYASDHDERFPNTGLWSDMTATYRKDPESLNCPAVGRFGYALSNSLPATAKMVARPASTPLIYESKTLAPNAFGNPRTDSCKPRHDRRNNRYYVDGSVRSIANNYP